MRPPSTVMVMVPMEPWSSALDWAVHVPSLMGLVMSRPVEGVHAARMVAPRAPRTAYEVGAAQRDRLSTVVGVVIAPCPFRCARCRRVRAG